MQANALRAASDQHHTETTLPCDTAERLIKKR